MMAETMVEKRAGMSVASTAERLADCWVVLTVEM